MMCDAEKLAMDSTPVSNLSAIPLVAMPRVAHDSSGKNSFGLALLVVLALAFMLPSMAAYGPWKPDEPYIFGLVDSLLKTGDWVVPTLAGEPFMEKPPLFVWVAALSAKLVSPWLAVEYGARLAIGIFMLITFIATASAARRWWGHGYGRYAVLALLAAIGLQQHGRMMIPDVPLLAGFAVALCGWAWIQERPRKGGLLFGTGLGMALMAKGVLGPGVLLASALVLPLFFSSWRTRAYADGMRYAFAASLPWVLVWPIALYLRSPHLFMEWFYVNNIGRFLGSSVPALGAAHESGHLLQTIPWFTFPTLPLAIWALWKMRREIFLRPGFQVSLVVLSILLAVFIASASGRVVYLLPMLVPLAIIATPAIGLLPLRANQWADWTARILFGAAAAMCWAVWFCFFVIDKPLPLSFLTNHLPLDIPFHFDPAGAALACLLMVGWLFITRQLPRYAARATASWVSGIVLVWGTIFALLLPWIDEAKSYQSTFSALSQVLKGQTHCLASVGLGESERAMLAYVADIEPRRLEINRGDECNTLLWQGVANSAPQNMASDGWQLKWEGSRPGERRERFWLFTRAHPPSIAKNNHLPAASSGNANLAPR